MWKKNIQDRCQGITKKVVIRYILLQLPAFAVVSIIMYFIYATLELQGYIALLILAAWMVKDALIFPFVWRAYDSGSRSAADAMIGKTGFARERLDPEGFVRVGNELWKAHNAGSEPVEKGEAVVVRDIQGLTLTVTCLRDGYDHVHPHK